MQFDIKIFEVKNENKGKYDLLTVDYKDLRQDKNSTKKVVSFTNKDVYNTLKAAQSGEEFTVTAVKGEQYWEWQNVSPRGQAPAESTGGNVAASKPAATTPKSTYETPEERAKRQVLIVRQSSLTNAIAMLAAAGDKKTTINPDAVIHVAKHFEAYVFGVEMPTNINSLPPLPNDDDIPY